MEPDVNKVLLPPDVCILRRDTNKLSNNVGIELRYMFNNTKQKNCYNTIKNALSEYQKRLQEYKEKIQSSIQIIAHFNCNYAKLASDNHTAKICIYNYILQCTIE